MVSSRPKSTYWHGFRDGLPFVVVVLPFSMVFGILAVEAGLTVAQAIGFSVVVVAGAAQFAALQLMTEGAPFAVIVATALAVNLRMSMYSASLAPHLGQAPFPTRALIGFLNFDQSFAMSMTRYDADPQMPLTHKVAYFFGVVSPVFPMWYAGTILGALAGAKIPDGLALDFAMPITFLAAVAPMLKTRAHLAAAVTSVVLALLLHWVPYSAGLLIAGFGAMIVGAWIEAREERR